MPFRIFESEARTIISETSGYIAQAGFTHSVTPARNCTYGCSYCYVPTMRVQGGLKKEDWERWGQFTTFKSNAAALLRKSIRGHEVIYCSSMVDPYQPAERTQRLMPEILAALTDYAPRMLVIQTRAPLILTDLALLEKLAEKTDLRVSFSVTTDRDAVRRLYEPHCEPIAERLNAIRVLQAAGIRTFATLAPLLPCDPEAFASEVMEATREDLVGDPLHTRINKPAGAGTRAAAREIALRHGHAEWFEPAFQTEVTERIRLTAARAGRNFVTGPPGFSLLAGEAAGG